MNADDGLDAGFRCTPAQASRTHAYLGTYTDFDADPKAAVAAAFARCCLACTPRFGLSPEAAASEVADMATRALAHPARDRLDLDPLLLATADTMLHDVGYDLASLHALLEEVARALVPLPAPTRRIGRVRLLSTLLRARGLDVSVEPRPGDASELIAEPANLLNAPAAQLAEVADHLAADGASLGADLTVMIALTALGELRNYRVDLGARLLRLAITLGDPVDEVRDGIDFVALQRRRDGAYGFVNPFASEEERSTLDRNFYLPMTLNAAWLFQLQAVGRASAHGGQQPQLARR